MTQITIGTYAADMTTWVFPALATVHWVPDSDPAWVKLVADDRDPFGHASLNRDSVFTDVRLIGVGFADFDPKGVPHSGTVEHAVMWTPWNAMTAEFSDMSVPVQDLLSALGSSDPYRLTSLLTLGDDVIYGLGREQGVWGVGPYSDRLVGGPGNDTIFGRGGHDTLEGGAGDDVIHTVDSFTELAWRNAPALVDGGPGVDAISYEDAPFGVVVDLGAGAGADTLKDVEVAVGSPFADSMSGSAAADTLRGGAGDDVLHGGGGNDFVDGGEGDDQAFGGAGDDAIEDAGGSNYLRGEEGNDFLRGGSGFDDVNGNVGDDTASGGAGDDWVVGGKDQDLLYGDGGEDIVYGNLGNDTCDGGDGNDIVRGGQGDDVVIGGAGNDWLSGDRGSDTITGGAGADVFHSFGDAGIDRVTDFSVAEGDRVQLDPGTEYSVAQVGADTVVSMTGGAQMILVGVQMATLPQGWIFGA